MNMQYENIEVWYNFLFGDFFEFERDSKLKSIVRYSNYPEKLFPTSLYDHQFQVAAIVKELMISVSGNDDSFDVTKMIIMALIHDDHEPFGVGDLQSGNEHHMTSDEVRRHIISEGKSVIETIEFYPDTVGNYNYGHLLWEAVIGSSCLYGQLVKLCDKYAGLFEAMHEIVNGNESFQEQKVDATFGRLNPTPIQYYRTYFSNVTERLPLIADSISGKYSTLAQLYAPLPESDLPMWHYDFCKKAIINHAPESEKTRLGL